MAVLKNDPMIIVRSIDDLCPIRCEMLNFHGDFDERILAGQTLKTSYIEKQQMFAISKADVEDEYD
ncbi:hypothetical protein Dimus_036721, partial [Dionaea muscipula]